jgi:hypothetical protein
MAYPKCAGPSYTTQRELTEMANPLNLGRRIGRTPEPIINTAKRLGISIMEQKVSTN